MNTHISFSEYQLNKTKQMWKLVILSIQMGHSGENVVLFPSSPNDLLDLCGGKANLLH